MACALGHVKDGTWDPDLIWKYLHEDPTPGKDVAKYNLMDPTGELNDRHKVYTMLVDGPDHTNPSTDDMRDLSMIPWNQNADGIVQRFGHRKACGSVVKMTFEKYMGWGGSEPESKSFRNAQQASEYIVRSLRNGKPLRVRLQSAGHYVGIVGARTGFLSARYISVPIWEFLYIDPWSHSVNGGVTIDYAGKKTAFLGIIRQDGDKLKYGEHGQHEVSWVDTHSP